MSHRTCTLPFFFHRNKKEKRIEDYGKSKIHVAGGLSESLDEQDQTGGGNEVRLRIRTDL